MSHVSRPELLLVALVATAHVALCPFAKVEESFNLQASHDVLVLGLRRVEQYDHIEFPGVVPRTFIGALAVSALASPLAWVAQALGLRRIALQYIVRWVLAMCMTAAIGFFSKSIATRFGKDAGRFFLLVSACQFHLMFYLGRTLPNVYALVLVLCAFAFWLQDAWKPVVFLLSFTTIVFRGDTAVLFAPILLSMLIARPRALFAIVGWGLAATVASLALTVAVDSYFWQRWLWPEGEVLWFNTVENKSHEWGVLPPLWYFYSALPRALLATALLVPFGVSSLLPAIVRAKSWTEFRTALRSAPIIDRSVAAFIWPIGLYLALFSLLPHKELRFVFNAIPMLNMAAAVGFAKLYRARDKTLLPLLGAVACLVATALGAAFFFSASYVNYPGGDAFAYLHQVASSERDVARTVHIDVPAAMTGVSRFGEEYRPTWSYSKDEAATTLETLRTFDYVLTGQAPETLAADFELLKSFATFERVQLSPLPPRIQTRDYIFVLQNRALASKQPRATDTA